MSDPTSILTANLQQVRDRIADAARRAGRDPSEVTLVGVTKYVSAELTNMLVEAGCRDLGESRPQALWDKAESLSSDVVRWHLIGHLQRNKLRRTLPYVHLLHAGDGRPLLEELNLESERIGRITDVLLEVNISGDAAKHGFAPDEILSELPTLAKLPHVKIRGLMTMAALEGGPERARRDFAALRELREKLRTECPVEIGLDELSMGMSGDFEEAILEGATLVRVGSALWEGIEA